MAKPGPATEEKALKVASEIGLNMDKLKKDRESPETTALIEKNLALGTAMGVGASCSTTLSGFLADRYGTSTAFLGLTAVACLAFLVVALAMPETRRPPRR